VSQTNESFYVVTMLPRHDMVKPPVNSVPHQRGLEDSRANLVAAASVKPGAPWAIVAVMGVTGKHQS
jgi:hypothetical protein